MLKPIPLAEFHPGNKLPLPPAPPLRLLFWETTTGCNLECVHCRRLEVSRELSKRDLTTEQARGFIKTLPETGTPILVFSGGEPLMRPDLFELAEEARGLGLPTALATNGTIMDEGIARRIVEVGIRRVSVSFDGPDAPTHDQFRGAGAFERSIAGVRMLRRQGMSVQINSTIARHNYRKLDKTYELALELGADALHLFMLVPVGCGMELPEEVMLNGEEYERALNWIYERSLEGKMHLKATCAPHYFRVVSQRETAARRATTAPRSHEAHEDPRRMIEEGTEPRRHGSTELAEVRGTERAQRDETRGQGDTVTRGQGDKGTGGHGDGGRSTVGRAHGGGKATLDADATRACPAGAPAPLSMPPGHPGGDEMTAVTKGCLAGQAVCFVSHEGDVFPCGYLPVSSGNVKEVAFPKIWRESRVFADLRREENLEGKCGLCEYKRVCMGCRARAFAATGSYLGEEPNCEWVPGRMRTTTEPRRHGGTENGRRCGGS